MREIKFRAWNKELKLLKKVFAINLTEDKSVGVHLENPTWYWKDIELMQYTGLKDKNGKEIYEGDIVDYLNTSAYWHSKGIVEYEQYNCAYVLRDDKYGNSYLAFQHSANWNVIGNIYENNELLKEKKK